MRRWDVLGEDPARQSAETRHHQGEDAVNNGEGVTGRE